MPRLELRGDTSERRMQIHFNLVRGNAQVMEAVAKFFQLSVSDALEAQITSLVSAIQASMGPGEWDDAARQVCEEINRRLTIRYSDDG